MEIYQYIIVFYCVFTYGWMNSERKRLFKFMVNDLHNAPLGTTETHCKIFSWVFHALAPLWFVYWVFKKVN
jgi:hypothetical protein